MPKKRLKIRKIKNPKTSFYKYEAMGIVNKFFYRVGILVSTYPFLTLLICACVSIVGGLGLINLNLVGDPQALWVSKTSRGNREQQYFNEKYGAFFRINQFILNKKGHIERDSSIDLFQKPYLEMVYHIQKKLEDQTLHENHQYFKLDDFCYKPISGEGCLVTSPMEFWLMNATDMWIDSDFKETAKCIKPRYKNKNTCFDRIGVPIMYTSIFGNSNFDPNSKSCTVPRINATSLAVTFLLNNNKYLNPLAEIWEKDVFIKYLSEVNQIFDEDDKMKPLAESDTDLQKKIKTIYQQHQNLYPIEVNYMAERGIPDDLILQNSQNIGVVIVSYSFMFLYISAAIGFVPSLLYSRFMVGFSGIIIVVCSLVISLGLCSYFGMGMTMISTEVVPFLILAIGVDNMFIIVRSERMVDGSVSDVGERLAKGLSNVGPSICTAATCEFLAFLVGVLTDIPALQSFCAVAAIAVLFDFFFQVTAFVAILTLDNKRIQNKRYDILFCLEVKDPKPPRKEIMRTFFEKYLTPLILKRWCHYVTAAILLFMFIFGILSSLNLSLGIDQKASVTTGSAIYKYFAAQEKLVDAGPPSYLVFRDINYTHPESTKKIFDLLDVLSAQEDTVQKPVFSWLKAFKMFTMESGDWAKICGTQGINAYPFSEQMRRFVKVSINSECCLRYGICGEQFEKDIVFDGEGEIESTRFRFFHPPLRCQADYIRDLQATRYIVDKFDGQLVYTKKGEEKYKEKDLDERRQVFPYSLFYVYFEQYYYIRGVLTENIMLALAAVIFATQLITNITSAFFVAGTVLCTAFSLIGMCYFLNIVIGGFGIEYNAVFVVNIVMTCGLSVEFCVHVMIAFLRSRGTNAERVKSAMNNMGSSVLVGIGSTKIIGVLILAFAPSTIFRLYYFRMYFSIIILGLFFGLIVLPIVLQYIGPPHKADMGEAFKSEKEEEEPMLKDQPIHTLRGFGVFALPNF